MLLCGQPVKNLFRRSVVKLNQNWPTKIRRISKMEKKSRQKFKVIYKESSLPEKEKRAILFEVFDILFSEKDSVNKNYKNKKI